MPLAAAGEALRLFDALRLRDLAAGEALRLRDLLLDLLLDLDLLRLLDLSQDASAHKRNRLTQVVAAQGDLARQTATTPCHRSALLPTHPKLLAADSSDDDLFNSVN